MLTVISITPVPIVLFLPHGTDSACLRTIVPLYTDTGRIIPSPSRTPGFIRRLTGYLGPVDSVSQMAPGVLCHHSPYTIPFVIVMVIAAPSVLWLSVCPSRLVCSALTRHGRLDHDVVVPRVPLIAAETGLAAFIHLVLIISLVFFSASQTAFSAYSCLGGGMSICCLHFDSLVPHTRLRKSLGHKFRPWLFLPPILSSF